MPRASSRSRYCISSIEPLMSANRAVTIFRSPASRLTVTCALVVLDANEERERCLPGLKVLSERRGRRLRFPRSERPHSPQHLKPVGLSALQFEQRFLSAPPQLPQK